MATCRVATKVSQPPDYSRHRILHSAKSVATGVNLGYVITSLEQCNSKFYGDIYNLLTGSSITYDPHWDEGEKCQLIVNMLERYMQPHINLDHIRGIKLAQCDELAVKNILDIFSVLVDTKCFPMDNLSEDTPPPLHTPPRFESHIQTPVHQSTPHISYCSRIFPPSSGPNEDFVKPSLLPLDKPVVSHKEPCASTDASILTSLYNSYVGELHSLSSNGELSSDVEINTSTIPSTSEACSNNCKYLFCCDIEIEYSIICSTTKRYFGTHQT